MAFLQEKKVSNHLVRRTARAKAKSLNAALFWASIESKRTDWLRNRGFPGLTNHFVVRSTVRGPFGWKVVAVFDPSDPLKLVTND
jgi:hypothetical protein